MEDKNNGNNNEVNLESVVRIVFIVIILFIVGFLIANGLKMYGEWRQVREEEKAQMERMRPYQEVSVEKNEK